MRKQYSSYNMYEEATELILSDFYFVLNFLTAKP